MYLLDTNIASAIIMAKNEALKLKVANFSINDFFISSITSAELKYGIERKPEALLLKRKVMAFLEEIQILSFTDKDALYFAQLKVLSEKQGKNLSCMDMLIASHAFSRDLILVTDDKAFSFIPNLKIENWLE